MLDAMRYSSKSQYFTSWGYQSRMDDNTWKLYLPKWWGYEDFWMRYFNTYLYIWKFPKINTHPPISAILGLFIELNSFSLNFVEKYRSCSWFWTYSTSNCMVSIYIEHRAGVALPHPVFKWFFGDYHCYSS